MPDRKPNLLFIWTDGQRPDTLACYGNDVVRAPNLNRLAEKSSVFEHAYVSQPLCTPARSTVMTGLYPHTTGCTVNSARLPDDAQTLAEMVSPEYNRAYIGKWHLGDDNVLQHGFDHWESIDEWRGGADGDHLAHFSAYHHFLVEAGYSPDTTKNGYPAFDTYTSARLPEYFTKAAFQGRETARWLRDNRGDPFVCYVNFLAPHTPWECPESEKYPLDNLATGPAFLQQPQDNASIVHRAMSDYYRQSDFTGSDTFAGQDLRTEVGWREIRSRYFALVTMMDRAVGTILTALEQTGQADDTIVVFTSDHGGMEGDHGMLGKNVMYEESAKVPLIIHVPWLEDGAGLIGGNISQIDLVPTLLDLLGEPVPDRLPGKSRVPVLMGEETLDDNDVFVQYNGRNGGIRNGRGYQDDPPEVWGYRPFEADGLSWDQVYEVLGAPARTVVTGDRWKLNLVPGDRGELYDLNTDHHEMVNVYDEPWNRGRIADMRERIRTWQGQHADRAPLPNV